MNVEEEVGADEHVIGLLHTHVVACGDLGWVPEATGARVVDPEVRVEGRLLAARRSRDPRRVR